MPQAKNSKSYLNLNTFIRYKLALFFLFTFFTFFALKVPVSILFLITLIFFTGSLIPSEHVLQRYAISSVLIIGLSPSYLLIRGFVVDEPLYWFDLYFYGIIFYLFFFIFFKNKKSSISLLNSDNLRQVIFGFSGLIFSLFLEIYLLNKSLGYGVAWISSGDSKNHLVASADLVRYGDLDPATFLTQPINLPSSLSLLLAQISTEITTDPETLDFQMKIYAYFWSLLIGLMGLSFAGAGQVLIGKREKSNSNVIYLLLSLIPFFSLVIGPALNDGFFTAIFGITTLVVMTTWFFESEKSDEFNFKFVAVGLLLFLSTLLSWMFITALTLPILIFGLRKFLRKRSEKHIRIDFIIFILFTSTLLFIHFSNFGQNLIKLVKTALTANGAVTASNPNFYYFLILILLVLGILLKSRGDRLGSSLIVLASTHFVSLFTFKFFSNLNLFSWNYYLIKYQWIMTVSLFVVVLSICLFFVAEALKNSSLTLLLVTLIMGISSYALSESVVPVNRVLPKIIKGWENPRSTILDLALAQNLDNKNPTMFFHYGYEGDAKLANFWMNAFSDPQDPIRGWNYTIDTLGSPKQLCDVNAYYPTVTVLTSDMKLEDDLLASCPSEKFIVKLLPPAF